MPYVDLAFRLTGSKVPVDHGYALYSTLSRTLQDIHEATNVGVHPIRGTYSGNGELMLRDSSRLVVLRLQSERIREFLKLAGKRLDIDGCKLRVGIPEVRLLRPRASLYSRLVTIKGFMEPATFLESAKRQLEKLGVEAEIKIGERRTFRVKDKQMVGFEVVALELDAEESLRTITGARGVNRYEMPKGIEHAQFVSALTSAAEM
jgi:CRISPR-associated protein Cas6